MFTSNTRTDTCFFKYKDGYVFISNTRMDTCLYQILDGYMFISSTRTDMGLYQMHGRLHVYIKYRDA